MVGFILPNKMTPNGVNGIKPSKINFKNLSIWLKSKVSIPQATPNGKLALEICFPVLIIKKREKQKKPNKMKNNLIFLFINRKILDPTNSAMEVCLR